MDGIDNAHALIVGIANYQYLNGLPPTVLKDAQDIYNLLIDPQHCGYLPANVQLLVDGEATQAAIRQALADIARCSNPDATVFFYISSHGGRLESGPYTGEYLLPVDTLCTSDQSLAETAISAAEFTDALRTIPARKVVVVFDCCHAGGIGQPKEATAPELKALPESYYETLKTGRGRVILASSRSTESSYVLPGAANSLFTQHLLAGLRGGAPGPGGVIRIFDLFHYLQPRVTSDQPNQHPIFKAEVEENFPIALYLGGKAPAPMPSTPPADQFAYDVFISYRQQEPNLSWVHKTLQSRLEAQGLRICIDHRDFRLGAPLVLEMARAVEQSRYTLAVWSPAYLTSNFTELENVLAEHLGLEKSQRRLLGVLREPCSPRLGMRARLWLDMTKDEELERNVERLVYELRQPPDKSRPLGVNTMADQPDDQYDLFISYAEADRAWVEGYLLDGLAQAGVRIHSETTFHLGQPRLNEFEHAVKQSKRVLLVLSPDYFGDPMNAFVDLLAAVHGLDQSTWPAVPLVLKRVELPLRLKALVSLDATEPAGWPAVIQKLCEELKRPVPALPSKPPCPYPGMRPFTEEESTVFFGRRQEVDDLLQCLRLHSFLAVIGRSGSGKSSLVFAGLVPALRKSTLFGVGDWLVRSMRPGETPHDTFLSLVPSDGVEPTAAATKLLADAQATHLLLVIDQFEEVFTLAIGSGQARAFQESLLRWINLPECLIVLTVRADFYQDLMTCPLWPQVQSHRYEVLSLGRDGLCEAIVLPAGRAQVYVEQSLVERLLNDAAAEPGMLPLVQETMVLLWEKLQRRFLPVNAYEDIDRSDRTGLQVAMAIRADAVMRDLLSDAHRVVARRIFLRLIQFGEGRLDMRRQQSRSQLRSQGDDPAVFDQTLDHLINARLLVAGESEHKDPPVDLAHERLITGWPTLQQYLRERREAEQKRRRLEDKAQEWIRLGSSSGGLLDSVQLLEAEQWLASLDAAELGRSDDLAALVQVSQAAIERDEREKEAARQRELAQAQALVAQQQRVAKEQSLRVRIAVTLGLVALVAAVVAFFFMRQARTQARIAISRQLIAQAFERLKGNELDLDELA